MQKRPSLGFGLGLRPQLYNEIVISSPNVDWFEVMTEAFLVPGGPPLRMLDAIRERYPVVMHGTSMSIAATTPLDMEYLKDLKALARRCRPKWISDHLCWNGTDGIHIHDQLPVPFTEEALDHVASRIKQVQDILGTRIAIENVSSYFQYTESELEEWEFLVELLRRADCWLQLDLNAVFVSGTNHDFSTFAYLDAVPQDRVVQLKLAGHSKSDGRLINTRDRAVCQGVWELYERAIRKFGPTTLIERDGNIPPLAELVNELARARVIAAKTLEPQAA